MRPMRLFIAVDPSAEMAARAGRIADRLRAAGVEAAWVQPSRMHLTLQFLGDDVDDADLHRICRAIDAAAAMSPPFRLFCAGVGVFPDLKRPRVAWLGVCGRPARRAVSRPVCANEKNPALSVDRKLRGVSTVGPHTAQPAPAVAPHDPPRQADV